MTRFYLIRHGDNEYVTKGAIAGRQKGISLNQAGRTQAEQLAQKLGGVRLDRIISSPLERCRETAEPLARRMGMDLELADELVELDFGPWTGQKFAELDSFPTWRRYNQFRSGTPTAGGELMLETQLRIVGLMQKLAADFPTASVALFSHGDVLRAALLYCLGMPLDFVHRLQIDVASVSVVEFKSDLVEIRLLNRCFDRDSL